MEHKKRESAKEEAARLQYWNRVTVNFVGIGYLCLVLAGILDWNNHALAGMTGAWFIAAFASWKAAD